MKKLCCILLICFLITGCSKTASTSANTENQIIQLAQITNNGTDKFVTVSKELRGYTATEKGYYSFLINSDASKTLMFTDYSTKEQVVLCSQPNCKHDNENCTAWIDSEKGEIMLATFGEKIAIIYTNFFHLNAESHPYIEIMDANGSNRKTLCEFQSNFDIAGDVLSNEKYLIIKISETQENDTGIERIYSIVAIDAQTGEKSVLHSIKTQSVKAGQSGELWLNIVGATDNGIIFFTREIKPYKSDINNVDATNSAYSEAMQFTYYEIPYNGTQIKEFYAHNAKNATVGVFSGGVFAIARIDDVTSFYKIDTNSGDKELMVSNLSEVLGLEKIDIDIMNGFYIVNQVKNKIIFEVNYSAEEVKKGNIESIVRTVKSYAVDKDTAEINELLLSNYFHTMYMPIEIFADITDNLLVLGEVSETVNADLISIADYRYAFMSKDDYLNSVPNFEFLNSNVKILR